MNKHNYDIKAETTSCYPINKGSISIEINGIRFSNIVEMLRYMDKQRKQLIEAKKIIKDLLSLKPSISVVEASKRFSVHEQAEQFLKEM